ncbi:glycosyltransferase [Acidocella sp.]|uniref:glycosyltransferase n=1 Tax=Acidocella sp. TaxID=50710 RepID=UPI0026376C65|nr:glycosyltransferase [Acidocella sp.]
MAAVDIAVPTYNCARWLDAFMESVIAQDFTDWRIVTRDDGSVDDTAVMMAIWRERLGQRVLIIENAENKNLGMIGNYDAVLGACSAERIMLGDPDDVWLPGKMSMTLHTLNSMERVFGTTCPLVICSDAKVVDERQNTLHTSFWKRMRLKPATVSDFSRVMMDNPVLTSTMLVNRALLVRAVPLSDGGICPDWWIALVACAFGKIVALSEKTILYRRHDDNDSEEPVASSIIGVALRIGVLRKRFVRLIARSSGQAAGFKRRFGGVAEQANIDATNLLVDFAKTGRISVRIKMLVSRVWFGSLLKTIVLLLIYRSSVDKR